MQELITLYNNKLRFSAKTKRTMRLTLIIGFILLYSIPSYAQSNRHAIALELSYPMTSGDNFINHANDRGYSGLISVGVDYNLIRINGLGIGILFNSSMLKLPETDLKLTAHSPKLKIEYEIDLNKISIIPQVGIGYSSWRFRAPEKVWVDEFGDKYLQPKFKKNDKGLTVRGSSKIVLNNRRSLKWYLNIAYEFTKLEKPKDGSIDNSYNRNIQILYPGIGVIWNFGK